MSFEGYCCSGDEVIEVYVNGSYVGQMEKVDPELNQTTYYCDIPQKYFSGKNQKITFISTPYLELDMEENDEKYLASFYMTELNMKYK